MIPILRTERLLMRAPTLGDFEIFAEFFASDRARFVGGPLSRREAWRSFAANFGQWELKGHGMWALEERATGVYLGQVGCWHPEGWVAREIGWIIADARAEGRGFAREAALLARRYAFETLGWTEVFSVIDPGNDRSIRLALRLGCTPDRDGTLESGHPYRLYRHPCPEALQ